MKQRWYHKVDVSKFQLNAGQTTLRRATQRRVYSALRNEPAVAATVLNTSMPESQMNRLAAERMAKQGYMRGQMMRKTGFAGLDDPAYTTAGDLVRERNGEPKSYEKSVFGEIGDFLTGIPKAMISGGATALTWLGNIIDTPAAAGASSGITHSAPDATQERLRAQRQALGLQSAAPGVGLAEAAVRGIGNWFQGAGAIVGLTDMSEQQQGFMEKAGLDPDSWTDRYRFYYNDYFDGGRTSSADQQLQDARNEDFAEQEISAATEYILSGAADQVSGGVFDDKFAGLSEKTQEWAKRINSDQRTPRDDRLLAILADDSAASPGGGFARAVGAKVGTPEFAITSAMGDLALGWYADPLGAVGSAVTLTRAARYGVRADELGQVPMRIAASDENGRALHRTGQAIDDALVAADTIHLLQASGRAEDALKAAKVRETFERFHPDMRQFLDAGLSTRSGAVSSWIPREGTEVTREAKRAVGYDRGYAPLKAGTGTGKPAWSLGRTDATEALDQAKLAEVRAKFADDMITGIVAETWAQGRPLFRGKILLPGSITMGARLRSVAAPIFDALGRQDAQLYKAIRAVEKSKKSIRVADAADNVEEFSTHSNQWVTNIADKGFGVSAMVRRGQATWEKSFSNAKVTFHDNAGTETMRRLVMQFMPKRQAYLFVNQWSQMSPAGRFGMYQELMTSMVESSGMRSHGQVGRRMAELLTRGVVSDGNETLSGMQAANRLFHNYASPQRNTILAEGREHAAGLFPFQMSDGVVLPSYAQMKIAMGRTVIANRILGISGKHFEGAKLYDGLRAVTSGWKAGKTGTFGNMQRQILEGVFLQSVIDPSTLLEVAAIRRAQASERAGSRMVQNEAVRGARKLTTHPDWAAEDIINLQAIQKDTAQFRSTLIDMGKNAGLSDDQARMLALLSENVIDIENLANTKKHMLWAMGPIDLIRKGRVEAAQRSGRYTSDSDWGKWVDEHTLSETLASYQSHMTSAHQGGLLLRPGQNLDPSGNPNTAIEDVKAAAAVGLPLHRALRPGPRPPNAWTQTSTAGDAGAFKYAEQLDRLHNDEIAGPLMRFVAHEHATVPRLQDEANAKQLELYRREARKGDKTAGNLRQELRNAKARVEGARRSPNADPAKIAAHQAEVDRLSTELSNHVERVSVRRQEDNPLVVDPAETFFGRGLTQVAGLQVDPTKVSKAEEYAAQLIEQSEAMSANSWRLLYDSNGRYIDPTDEAGRQAAIAKVAQDQVDEIRHLLGIREGRAPTEILPMLRKVADGQPPTAKDLAAIPDELRPPEVAHHVYVPDIGAKNKRDASQKLAEMSTRYYDFFVGRPMARLWTLPLFQAELDQGYRLLEPFAEHLVSKGMSREAAGQYLLHTTAKYATQKVFNTTDNVSERSMFMELADNWFMFSRAMENFFHRFGKAMTYNPGRLARMWLAAEAASTAGVVYSKPVDSEQGDERELYFTYPGSAMMARFTNDILRSLGFGDGVQQPVYAGAESPVKWLNPSLTNPIGVTANPMFGNSLRVFRALSPATWAPDFNAAIYALEGGEEFFASQGPLKALLPSNLYRLAEMTAPDAVASAEAAIDGRDSGPNSKLASNTMFAMRVAAGAGLLPGPDATAQERQDATRAMRVAAHNALVWRTLFGLFGPAVAMQDGFETAGEKTLPRPNEIARKNGIDSIQNEFWQILNDASEAHGSDVGFAMAMEEWARRHPQGELIYNPNAFTVGSSQMVGAGEDDLKSIPRTMQMVQWFRDNPEMHDRYSTLLPFTLPAVSDGFFDSEANRLMYEMGILERKDPSHFYNQVVNAGYIADWWKMKNAHIAGAMTDSAWYEFDADWKMMYPMASAEKDRRSAPEYVHNELSTELQSFLEEPDLPAHLAAVRPQMQELYDDYAAYREEFTTAKPWDRYAVNSDYREAGNKKWLMTPLNDLWKAFDVFEGNR